MSNPDQKQREWLNEVLKRLNITATELARKAGLNPSTVTRFLNEQTSQGHTLTIRTVNKIEDAARALGGDPRRPGMAEEAEPFNAEAAPVRMRDAVDALVGKRNACDPWILKNNELSAFGLLTGDVLVVDMNEMPAPGDIVCAQVYDQAGGTARTIFRMWEPPFLISGSPEPGARRPHIVDNTNAVVRGVMIGAIKPRSSERRAA